MTATQRLSEKWSGLVSNLRFDNWAFILVQRLLARHVPLVVFKRGKLTLIVDYDANDQNGIRECLSSRMYRRYLHHIGRRQPLTVLDLGGNTGGFICCLIDAGHGLAKAVSVEMNPNTFARLRFNVAYNGLASVTPVNAAVFTERGTIRIQNSKGNPGQSIFSQVPSDLAVTVPTVTFDDLVTEHFSNDGGMLDLVKIDIEGAEYAILESDACTQLRRFKHLIIEIHRRPELNAGDLIARIESFGFTNETDLDADEKDVFYFRNTAAAGRSAAAASLPRAASCALS